MALLYTDPQQFMPKLLKRPKIKGINTRGPDRILPSVGDKHYQGFWFLYTYTHQPIKRHLPERFPYKVHRYNKLQCEIGFIKNPHPNVHGRPWYMFRLGYYPGKYGDISTFQHLGDFGIDDLSVKRVLQLLERAVRTRKN